MGDFLGLCVMGLVVFLLKLCSSSGSLVNRTRMFLFDVIICGMEKFGSLGFI